MSDVTILPPDEQAQLVTDPRAQIVLTTRQTCDAHTALCRALASYLAQQSVIGPDGREHRFCHAFDTWASPEDFGDYPSLAVYSTSSGSYDASGFTPNAIQRNPVGDGLYVYSPHDLALDLTVEVWTDDPEDRAALAMMIENTMTPHQFTSALRLRLPFYFGQTCTFTPVGNQYLDDDATAVQRYRKVQFVFKGTIPVTRLAQLGKAKIMARGTTSTAPLSNPDET